MGARRLAQTLVAEHLLSNAQVVAALQRQTLIGGSLDTNILELQLLHENTLLSAMERAYGVGAVGRSHLDRIPRHVARLFPLAFAQQYDLVPMGLSEQTLTVVGREPPDDVTTLRIWEQYQLHVVAQVTIEARVHDALHRLYDVALEPRFAQLLTLLDGFEQLEQGAGMHFEAFLPPPIEAPAASVPVPAPASVASLALSASALPASATLLDAPSAPSEPAAQMPPAPAAADATSESPELPESPESPESTESTESTESGTSTPPRGLLKQAIAKLEAEPDRDRAIATIIAFAHMMFDYVGIFVVHGSKPHGWRSSEPHAVERWASIDAELIRASVLRTIRETQSPYLGPLPTHEANERFLQFIGRPWPKVACLAPILVAGRLAALVYADNGERHVSSRKVAALMTLIQRCGMAWERLIRARKQAPADASGTLAAAQAAGAHIGAAASMATGAAAGAAPDAVPGAIGGQASPWVPLRSPSSATLGAAAGTTPNYVMFSEVTDSPQQSLGDWQDVFVEVSQQDDPTGAQPRHAKSTARWSDVIVRAHAASRLVPAINRAAPADPQILAGLLEALDSPTPSVRQSAIAQLLNLGSWADDACQAAFPGKLICDVWRADTILPPFGRCSGLCHLLSSRGHEATALVLPHMASQDRTQRLLAVYFFQAVHDPTGCPGLTLCLYDSEKRIRHLAIETLRQYRNEISYAYTVQVLREQLQAQDPAGQRFAIQALGQLREIFAVPALIPLVAVPDREIARAAASALAVICGQSFGTDVSLWQTWWQGHHYQPRPAWLLAGLSHANPTIRRVAHHELQHITGQVLDFDPQASAQEREQRTQVWQHWLQTHDLDAAWHPTMGRA